MVKKYIRFLSFLLIFSLSFGIIAFAHGGRTDSSGGHRDNNNVSGLGYYHYHCNGHPPHLHENGICPYSSNGWNNMSVTKQSQIENKERNQIQGPEPIYTTESDSIKEKSIDNPFTPDIIIFSAIGLIVLRYFLKYLDRSLHQHEPTIQNQVQIRNECVIQNNIFVSNSINSQDMPSQYTIGEKGLPADVNAPRNWGKTFTVYLNPKTHIYHRGRCRYVNPSSTYPTHILLVYQKNSPCKICHPEIPDMTWYFQYIEQHKELLPKENKTFKTISK